MSHNSLDTRCSRRRRYEAPADTAMSHVPSNEQVNSHLPTQGTLQESEKDLKPESRVLRVFLPPTLPSSFLNQGCSPEVQSWSNLVPNPLIGVVGDPVKREEYQLYCDPCQKGFYTKERYDKHMEDHVWCTFPGCNFSCRRGKEWKMEMHLETLHNRPDAPNLADVATYLSQRKKRFPTQSNVKSKVEELFYKASRGVELPDERRRWLRQHGILVRKHPRTDETYIASDALRPSRTAGSKSSQQQPRDPRDTPHNPEAKANANDEPAPERPPPRDPPPVSAEPSAAADAASDLPPPADAPGRPKRVVPLGPNGTLSRGQRVQLMREKYRDARHVPRFYVCHRCGVKGAHWVDDCPRRDDEAFDRQMVWGEERRDPPRTHSRASEAPAPEERGERGERGESEAPAPEERGESEAPEEETARRSGEAGAGRDVTSVMAPVAAAAAKRRRKEDTQQRGERRVTRNARPRQPPPTLFGRFCEAEQMNEQGLLLQAIHFFVMESFFEE